VIQRGDLGGSAGQHLYAIDPSGNVDALNPQTGQVEYSLSKAVKVLAVDSSRVYASCNDTYGDYVCAYDISTGALQWTYVLQWAGFNNTAEADGVLYLNTGEALNAATGQRITRLWDPSYNAKEITVGDGRLAVVADPRVVDLFGLPGA
jgi:outer membrane protein assembly factor BamB